MIASYKLAFHNSSILLKQKPISVLFVIKYYILYCVVPACLQDVFNLKM